MRYRVSGAKPDTGEYVEIIIDVGSEVEAEREGVARGMIISRISPDSQSELSTSIAVIDVETTGLFPLRHDRVIEVAAVVMRVDGQIEREFTSLVNPARDIGPTSVHGLTSEDILQAPKFEEIAALLVETLEGTVAIAGHNVPFDRQFLDSEFSRIGQAFPVCEELCTMRMGHGGNLATCCQNHGIRLDGDAHQAITDARATTGLLARLLAGEPRLVSDLRRRPPIRWPSFQRFPKQPLTRTESRRRQNEPPTYLQLLLGRASSPTSPSPADGAIAAYKALLDRVLEDRAVEETEAGALVEMAGHWGLPGDKIRSVHQDYLEHLALAAVADGVVTETERRDLTLVARLLGLDHATLDELLKDAASRSPTPSASSPPPMPSAATLVGKRVCFTGEMQCRYQGNPISRELADQFAISAGLEIMNSVTKKLDLLVVADPHTQSGKAQKARQYGVRIMHEPVFWTAIGGRVE